MNKLMTYFKPTSLTWWVSFVIFLSGMVIALAEVLPILAPFAVVINAMDGAIPASVLISTGLMGIGLYRPS